MSRRPEPFKSIADRADLDYEEALLMAWAADLDDVVDDEASTIPARRVPDVERALGIVPYKDMTKLAFWEQELGVTGEDLRRKLREEFDVVVGSAARRLPKGALKRMRGSLLPGVQPASLTRDSEVEPFEWSIVGTERSCRHLTEDEVLAIHNALVEDFARSSDPISPPGVKSADLLSSAVSRPRTSLADEDKYPTVEMAGAALMHSLVLNHPFHNGNKRTALVSLLVFLDENGMTLDVDQNEVFKFTLRVARHGLVPPEADRLSDREVLEIATWIKRHSRHLDRRTRPMKWIRLEKVLRAHGCEFDFPSVGNRINIRREVERKGLLGRRRRRKTLSCQARRSGGGDDATRDTVTHIRRELQLDEPHGVDTEHFLAGTAEDEFIVQYRQTLRRLGRL